MLWKITSTCLEQKAQATLLKILSTLLPNNHLFLNDLRSDTNLLVINTTYDTWYDSKKFQYVVKFRPDIRIIDYEAVLQLFHDWLNGVSDSTSTINLNFLPQIKIFHNLSISISRLQDPKLIETLTKAIESNGGTVTQSLSNNTFALITENNKLGKSGKRYEKAREWNISIVEPQWCFDSIKRGLLLEPKYYLLGLINHADACDWENLLDYKQSLLNNNKKRSLNNDDAEPKDDTSSQNTGGTALGVDLTLDAERKVKLKMVKKNSHNKIWGLIMNDIKSNDRTKDEEDLKWLDTPQIQELKGEIKDSSSNDKTVGKTDVNGASSKLFINSNFKQNQYKLFKNLRFKLTNYNYEERKILTKVITDHHGVIVTGKDLNYDYNVTNFQNSEVENNANSVNTITELAIERSMFYNELKLDPNDLWNKPINSIDFRKLMNGFAAQKPIQISITNFKSIELTHITKIINKLAVDKEEVKLAEYFNKSVDLLIVNNQAAKSDLELDFTNNDKIKAAKSWGTKIVSLDKFLSCL